MAGRIVVGIEGSGGARAALRFAIDEARHRDAAVEIITAYVPAYIPVAPDLGYVPLEPADLEIEITNMQADLVAEITETCDITGIEITKRIAKGRAADTLIAAAEGADMLVVGSRGRGGFRGLLLGSVSQQIAQHATCPVVIVRADLDDSNWVPDR